jgi:rubrerythrin
MTMEDPGIVDEILEMAVAREVDANRFYLALASGVQNPQLRAVFEVLAAEELEHKEILELEIIKTGKTLAVSTEPVGLINNSYDYSKFRFDVDYKSILLIGMQKEQASIKLYTDLAGMVTDPQAKQVLLAIAEEEGRHMQRFQEALDRTYRN